MFIWDIDTQMHLFARIFNGELARQPESHWFHYLRYDIITTLSQIKYMQKMYEQNRVFFMNILDKLYFIY